MSRTVRTLDVLAAISMFLLALALSGWAVEGIQPLPISGENVELFVTSFRADAQLGLVGREDLVQQQVASPLGPAQTSLPGEVHFRFLGISFNNFGRTGLGYRTATGVVPFTWTLTISLWYFVGLFSIAPLIWLACALRHRAKNRGVDSAAPASSFSLRNMFIAVTLVAVAGGMQALLQTYSYRLGPKLLLWYGSGALVGAAIFGMVRRPIVGAFIGLLFQGILIVVMKTLFKISL